MVIAVPFDQIKETGDRSWSMRLVDELARDNDDNRDEVVGALLAIEDIRTVQPILAIIMDARKSDAVRKAASDILSAFCSDETTEDYTQWWASNDPIIVRHALLMSKPSEAARVVSIALDPSHTLYLEALRTIEYWEPPQFQKLLIHGLNHQNSRVRKTAAKALIWEQPVAAEARLLELALDEDEDVAIGALDTLAYCASREILSRLDDLRRNGPHGRRQFYENTFCHVQEEFCSSIPDPDTASKEYAYLLEWLQPIEHLLEKPTELTGEETILYSAPIAPQKVEMTAQTIIDDLSEVDGTWYDKKNRYYMTNWATFSVDDRRLLKDFFKKNSDPTVRQIGASAYAAWQDTDALLTSLHDRAIDVQRAAAFDSRYMLGDLTIAKRLKELVEDLNVMNSFATEALESYIHQSNGAEITNWLVQLAVHDSRPSVRCTAIYEIVKINNREESIKKLLPILDESPANNWGVHCAVLSGSKKTWIKRSTLDYLKSVDNLFLQVALASCLTDD